MINVTEDVLIGRIDAARQREQKLRTRIAPVLVADERARTTPPAVAEEAGTYSHRRIEVVCNFRRRSR